MNNFVSTDDIIVAIESKLLIEYFDSVKESNKYFKIGCSNGIVSFYVNNPNLSKIEFKGTPTSTSYTFSTFVVNHVLSILTNNKSQDTVIFIFKQNRTMLVCPVHIESLDKLLEDLRLTESEKNYNFDISNNNFFKLTPIDEDSHFCSDFIVENAGHESTNFMELMLRSS